ncbi:MAG: hypothetical protein ACE15C_21280 [Phycisphaerae bacterium]
MAREIGNPQPTKQVAVTDAEEQVIQRLRMTPEERAAEQEARNRARLDAMSPDQRQAEDARAAKLAAMTPQERQAFFLGRHLADLSRLLKRATGQGLDLAGVVAAQEKPEGEAIAWLAGELAKTGAGN